MVGWLGALWVVRVQPTLENPERVDEGFFSAAECPVWAPNRSTLAYLVRSPSGAWSLRRWRVGSVAQIAVFKDAVPSVLYRTLAWRPGGGGLAYLDGGSIWSSRGGAPRVLGRRGSLRRVELRGTRGAEKGYDPAARILSYSPNGRWLAASVGAATGIFRANGRRVRIVPGHLMGWSGSIAVLTEGFRSPLPANALSLSLYPEPSRQSVGAELQVGCRHRPGGSLVRVPRCAYTKRHLPTSRRRNHAPRFSTLLPIRPSGPFRRRSSRGPGWPIWIAGSNT